MDPYNRIHLSLWKPWGSVRAKALCGATLRKNMPYDVVTDYLESLESGTQRRWVYQKSSDTTHGLMMVENYQESICPECVAHPDIALALLAAVP